MSTLVFDLLNEPIGEEVFDLGINIGEDMGFVFRQWGASVSIDTTASFAGVQVADKMLFYYFIT